jgi:hypothetical protein
MRTIPASDPIQFVAPPGHFGRRKAAKFLEPLLALAGGGGFQTSDLDLYQSCDPRAALGFTNRRCWKGACCVAGSLYCAGHRGCNSHWSQPEGPDEGTTRDRETDAFVRLRSKLEEG